MWEWRGWEGKINRIWDEMNVRLNASDYKEVKNQQKSAQIPSGRIKRKKRTYSNDCKKKKENLELSHFLETPGMLLLDKKS